MEADGRTLLPGFFASHVHLQVTIPASAFVEVAPQSRDLGWTPSILLSRRAALHASGPDLLAVGGILCSLGGYPGQAGWVPEKMSVL